MLRALLFLTAAYLSVPVSSLIACTASTYCGNCNSDGFTVTCQCQESATVHCSCSDGTCQSPGQCCITETGGPTNCSKLCCAGSCTNFAASTLADRGLREIQFLLASFKGQENTTADPKQIEVLPDATVPASIEDIRADIGVLDVKDLRFKVRNVYTTRLRAFVLQWYVYAQGQEKPLVANQEFDQWAAVNQDENTRAGGVLSDKGTLLVASKAPIQHVAARIVYAEFADGKKFGPGVTMYSKDFEKNRSEYVSVYQAVANKLAACGAGCDTSKILQPDLHDIVNVPEANAYRTLQMLLAQGGVSAVKTEIGQKLQAGR